MAVLQLQGESAQLRKVARSFAAGDLTLTDYRNVRMAIIESFVAELNGDLTPTFSAADVPMVPLDRHQPSAAAAQESPWSLLALLGSAALLAMVALAAILLG